MLIETEDTPNPAALKFLPGRPLPETKKGSIDIRDKEEAAKFPLARNLFAIAGVSGVFLGRDFVTVTKETGNDWADIKPQILAAIMEYFSKTEPVALAQEQNIPTKEKNETPEEQAIRALIEERIRPALARDGGDIVFHGFQDGIVYVSLRGACAGCPSAAVTLKIGVERFLQQQIPSVKTVRAEKPPSSIKD